MNTKQKNLSESAIMFANRLTKKRKHLRKWLNRESINAYRIYDADMPEYALAIDVYNTADNKTHVIAYEYQAPATIDKEKAAHRLKEALIVILNEFDIPEGQLYLKVRKKQKGSEQYEKLKNRKISHELIEDGLRFLLNFSDYLDTGLFLDHRLTRKLIQHHATSKRFLNLFAYTGSVSVYAAKGGASHTATIDMSNTYLEIAKSNMALNNFTGIQHQFVHADCLQWLQQESQRHLNKFDLIFLDPPAFSTSKRMTSSFDVLQDHPTIIQHCMAILSATGLLIFTNNNRKFKLHPDLTKEFDVHNISAKTIPKDFESNRKIHNSWEIRHKNSDL